MIEVEATGLFCLARGRNLALEVVPDLRIDFRWLTGKDASS